MAQGWPSHADGEEGVQLRSDQERESNRVLGRRRVAWSFANFLRPVSCIPIDAAEV